MIIVISWLLIAKMDAFRPLTHPISLVYAHEDADQKLLGKKVWLENQLCVMNTIADFWNTYNGVQKHFDQPLFTSNGHPEYISNQLRKGRMHHDRMTSKIGEYNNCFILWCFARDNVTNIPFKRIKNMAVNSLDINLGDCEESKELSALCNYDAKDPVPFKGYIPWLIAIFTCGMLTDFTVTAIVFNKTITFEYNKPGIIFKNGYRLRILVSDIAFLPALKKYMQNEFVTSYINYYFPSCKDTQAYKELFSKLVVTMSHN